MFISRFYILFIFSVGFVISLNSQSLEEFSEEIEVDQILMYRLPDFSLEHYEAAIGQLVSRFEEETGNRLVPGEKKKVGLKVYTNSGAGLCTPPFLVEAMILFLEERGFQRKELFIIDVSTDALWRSGYIGSRASEIREFNEVPVYALDEGIYYDSDWFYDSPLPSQYVSPVELKQGGGYDYDVNFVDDRKSFLPTPLLLNVDFWVNMPVVMDHSKLGINGVLANSTLWNISNQFRFMSNSAGASAAIAEIAAIPELLETFAFSVVSLEKFQFMGGPVFNSGYVRSFNELYLSRNSVALDRIFLEKINRARATMGFEPVSPLPPVFEYARSLDLGDFEKGTYEIVEIK